MQDFETHPAGEIARLEAYLARRRKSSQTDFEDIHSYDSGCATEAVLLASDIEALIAALTRANAATAAAYEVAAREVECGCGAGPCQDTANCAAKDAADIRALAMPDQRSALDRLIAEAVKPYLEALQEIELEYDPSEGSGNARSMYDIALAASKKGGA